MKKVRVFFPVLILFLPYVSFGQDYLIQRPEKPFIEVTGIIEKEIIPDEIYISIKLSERMEGKTKISIEQQETALKSAIQSLGIDMKNLSLKGAIASYRKVKWTKKDVMANSEYLLMVSDAKTVGLVFDKLEALKITNANISRVDHSKIKEFKKETRINAIKAAKEKAEYLLEAIGEEVGMPLLIREQYDNSPLSRNSNGFFIANESYRNEVDLSSVDLQFEKITVSSSVYVKFGIKEKN